MKHNNTFKMIGPWIGAAAGLFVVASNFAAPFFAGLGLDWLSAQPICPVGVACAEIYAPVYITPIAYIIFAVVGFLLGWLIQSIIKKVIKR